MTRNKSEIADLAKDTEVSFLPMELVGNGTLTLEKTKRLEDVWQGFTYFRERDLLIAKITPSFENGKGAFALGLVNGIGFGTTELHVIRVGDSIDSKFLYYLTVSYSFRMFGASQMYGTAGQKRVPDSFINDFQSPIPPLPEQRAIAAFLAAQTAKIDSLLAKKERLIELLKEKRTALINHAVTKGFDPKVEMKDSGVAWLGEVPKGWEVKRIKQLTSLIGSGKTPKGGAEVYSGSGVIFLRSQNVHFAGLRLDDVVYISEAIDQNLASTRVISNDVLLNITGASLGRCAIVPKEFPAANVNQHVCIIRSVADQVSPNFLRYCISSESVQAQIFSGEEGVSREGLTFSQIGSLTIALPIKIEEQRAIAAHLDQETTKIDALIAKVGEAMERLREYRAAIIAAAVTGKVDVTSPLDSLSRK